jgi:hypothetical protein
MRAAISRPQCQGQVRSAESGVTGPGGETPSLARHWQKNLCRVFVATDSQREIWPKADAVSVGGTVPREPEGPHGKGSTELRAQLGCMQEVSACAGARLLAKGRASLFICVTTRDDASVGAGGLERGEN